MMSMYIAVDFDGTIVEHVYPEIGKPVPLALETMKDLINAGHKIILNTMRGHKPYKEEIRDENNKLIKIIERDTLQEAVDFLESNGVELYGINKNPNQYLWTDSNKVYGHIYIDDAGFGCPLIFPADGRPYVDWTRVRKIFNLDEE
jgi:hydroxymethylpyrimidine pyrophosphatase-like HAD family hydrolase